MTNNTPEGTVRYQIFSKGEWLTVTEGPVSRILPPAKPSRYENWIFSAVMICAVIPILSIVIIHKLWRTLCG